MVGDSEDQALAAQKVPDVMKSFSDAAPDIWDKVKEYGGDLVHLMHMNPNATKWITLGLGTVAGISWANSLSNAFFSNFPRLDNFFTRFIVTGLLWVAAFLGASKLADYLSNGKSALQDRAQTQQLGNERLDRARKDWLVQGGNPNVKSVSLDPYTNFDVFYKEWDTADREGRHYQIPPADRPQGQTAFQQDFAAGASQTQRIVQDQPGNRGNRMDTTLGGTRPSYYNVSCLRPAHSQ